jgi:hypothetical protein
MSAPFVPPDFEVPTSFAGPGFRLQPLGAEHNERDHEAWMTSIAHIKATPGFEDSDWPHPMSLEANMSDLVQHAKEFEQRTAFTYSVLDDDEVIGCLYINPTTTASHDAFVTSWVRESRATVDSVVWRAVSEWLTSSWPFANPEYASRGLG